jgi:hypothetical protein
MVTDQALHGIDSSIPNVAKAAAPDAHVVYVDNDRVVCVHGRVPG